MPRLKTLPPKPGKDQLLVKSQSGIMKQMKPGEKRTGFLGDNILHKPDYKEVEDLNAEETTLKKILQLLLAKWIEPNSLSVKSTPALDRKNLILKLKKSTLKDLLKLLPDSMKGFTIEQFKNIGKGETDITDEQLAEIQDMYRDVSP